MDPEQKTTTPAVALESAEEPLKHVPLNRHGLPDRRFTAKHRESCRQAIAKGAILRNEYIRLGKEIYKNRNRMPAAIAEAPADDSDDDRDTVSIAESIADKFDDDLIERMRRFDAWERQQKEPAQAPPPTTTVAPPTTTVTPPPPRRTRVKF